MPLPVNGAQPTSGYTPAYDGPEQPCYCGNINCIETFISGTGFARRFPAELTSQEIIEAAEQETRKLVHTGSISLTRSPVASRQSSIFWILK